MVPFNKEEKHYQVNVQLLVFFGQCIEQTLWPAGKTKVWNKQFKGCQINLENKLENVKDNRSKGKWFPTMHHVIAFLKI